MTFLTTWRCQGTAAAFHLCHLVTLCHVRLFQAQGCLPVVAHWTVQEVLWRPNNIQGDAIVVTHLLTRLTCQLLAAFGSLHLCTAWQLQLQP